MTDMHLLLADILITGSADRQCGLSLCSLVVDSGQG